MATLLMESRLRGTSAGLIFGISKICAYPNKLLDLGVDSGDASGMPRRRAPLIPCPRDLLTIYQCFGDETRLRILNVLLLGPLYVKQIMRALCLEQALVSRHLAYLRRRGLVRANRDGKLVEYSLAAIRSEELQANLEVLERFARGVEVYERDLKALGRMRRRRYYHAIID